MQAALLAAPQQQQQQVLLTLLSSLRSMGLQELPAESLAQLQQAVAVAGPRVSPKVREKMQRHLAALEKAQQQQQQHEQQQLLLQQQQQQQQ
jgi:hypothetical protein